MNNAQLQGAWLVRVQLQNAELDGAALHGAWLMKASLQGAMLPIVHLYGAWLSNAHLECAELFETRFAGAVLNGVHLQGAYDDEETVDKSLSFEKRIAEQVGRASNLTTVTFSGGIKQEHYHTMLKELHECARQKWLTRLSNLGRMSGKE